MSSLRPLFSRLGLALAAGLVTLVAAEAAVRAYFAFKPRRVLADELAKLGPFPQGGNGRWLQALQVVPNERICYRLASSIDGFFEMGGRQTKFRTNSYGFRGPEWTREKPAGTVRIVGLGDSVMMGWGVEEQESYLHLLEQALNASGDGVRYEAINLAVGGYNTVQEVETLREVGLALQPDVVILGLVSNDASDIIYRGEPPSPLTLERSFLRDALVLPEGAGWPPSHAGWGELQAALTELADMQRAHGFQLLVISNSPTPETSRMLEIAGRLGMQTLDLDPALRERLRGRGGKLTDLELPKDPHPSPLAHQLIAAELVRAVSTMRR